MFPPLEPSGLVLAAVMVMAASLAAFVVWNAVIDMLRPPWGWPERAARAITQRLGSRLTREERVRLYVLILRIITGVGGDAQGGAVRR